MHIACKSVILMPTLQVRDLPDHLYRALKQAARAEHRSLSQQAIVTLARGLALGVDHRQRRAGLLAQWQQAPLNKWVSLEVSDWVRADRDSR
ncbi:MAG: hypothetical protein OHK0039_09890 [Bacteroidia bacterium]